MYLKFEKSDNHCCHNQNLLLSREKRASCSFSFPLLYRKRILTFVFSAIYCSEYVKIFSGDGTLVYHKEGCCPNDPGSFIEIPFMQSENIKVNILLTELQSRITSHFVILKHGLHSGKEKCFLSLRFKFAQSPYFLHSF